jgi:hypothetical protein
LCIFIVCDGSFNIRLLSRGGNERHQSGIVVGEAPVFVKVSAGEVCDFSEALGTQSSNKNLNSERRF